MLCEDENLKRIKLLGLSGDAVNLFELLPLGIRE